MIPQIVSKTLNLGIHSGVQPGPPYPLLMPANSYELGDGGHLEFMLSLGSGRLPSEHTLHAG